MASSSTSSIPMTSFKYDVFLSFRGEDTRTNFVDHLYHALMRENIETYKDDKNLEKGKRISKELIEAIEESRFHVIVFSKNYASSSWCLDELVKIMECQMTKTGRTVYPIFYNVEPTHVRKQSGDFGKSFSKHENDEAVEKWRKALVEATSFGGWDLRSTANGHEVEFIKIVVKDVLSKLPAVIVDENLVGMRTRINGVVSSLNDFSEEIYMIGILGMGGSGKTTLARAVFDQIRNEVEGASFVENVRESSTNPLLGLKSLQQQVLRDVLKRQDIFVNGVLEGKTEMKKKMHGIKVLVVLDDVDHIDQLKALAGQRNWFKSGSKIIITTRDKQVLVAHKVNSIHNVSLLTNEEAVCLLSRCAFGTNFPSPGYKELSEKVVSYAAGLPLTITILGSSLCEAKEHEWIDTIERLKKIPLKETIQKLELSYTGLDDDCKEIFLDVACILKGWNMDEAIRALQSCGFHAIHGLNILEKRSLITVSEDRYLGMHDHIEEMGRHIVRRSNLDEPGRHTRLWIEDEIKDILVNDLGTEATTCIHLIKPKVNRETIMKGLRKMEKLRFLLVNPYIRRIDREFDEDSQYLPNSLRFLKWSAFNLCVLPKKFQASNLVALEMPYSGMEQLWEGGERKVLHKLRFLDLSNSLLRTFDLGLTPNLETLNLKGCYDLVEFHMSLQCPKLKSLNLNGSKLSTLDLRFVTNIETLNLMRCLDLVELNIPCECPQLKFLNMSSPKLRSLDLRLVPNIVTLSLNGCCDLVELDIPCECPQLISLDLSSSKLRSLDLRLIPNIETLNLEKCKDLVELNMPHECPQLKSLSLSCPALRSLNLDMFLEFPQLECDYLVEFDMFLECPQLESLVLEISTLRTLAIGPIPNLKTLNLQGCHNLVELHMPDGCLKLESIIIGRCSELKTLDLRQTPNLENLHLVECSSLVELHAPIGGLKKLINLKAKGFLRFTNLNISTTNGSLSMLVLHGKLIDVCPLHPDNNFPKFQFECSYEEDLPSSIGNIEKLISVGFSCACTDLESFFESICGLKHLGELRLVGSIPEVLKDLDRLQCLERLIFSSASIKHLPDSILLLKHLKSLTLNNCELLEKLPEDLGRLECLEELTLKFIEIKHLPDSICMLKHLKYLNLCECELLEKLPEDIGRLECLSQLTLKSKTIKHLPDSIYMLKRLTCLTLSYCELLEKLPEDLGRLECLTLLMLQGCTVLQYIPNSICRLRSLWYFSLNGCSRVEELPDQFGRLECLKWLDIRGTCINNLPQSILMLQGLEFFQDETPTTLMIEGPQIIRREDETPTTASTGDRCVVL